MGLTPDWSPLYINFSLPKVQVFVKNILIESIMSASTIPHIHGFGQKRWAVVLVEGRQSPNQDQTPLSFRASRHSTSGRYNDWSTKKIHCTFACSQKTQELDCCSQQKKPDQSFGIQLRISYGSDLILVTHLKFESSKKPQRTFFSRESRKWNEKIEIKKVHSKRVEKIKWENWN